VRSDNIYSMIEHQSDTPLIPDPAIEPTISVPRAAKITGVSLRTAYDAVHKGEWPYLKVRGSYRILTARFLAQYGFISEPTAWNPSETGLVTSTAT
jgi:excisionase family DNA binding protein